MRIIDFDASHIYQDSITEKKMTERGDMQSIS